MSYRVVQKVSNSRSAFLEIVVAAIVIGICVGIIATFIYSTYEEKSNAIVIGAITILIVSTYALSQKLGSSGHAQLTIKSFLLLSKDCKKVINVPRYHYGEALYRYLTGAFVENSALKAQWLKEPMASGFKFDPQKGTGIFKRSASSRLVEEATEYYVLDTLSTHLTDYFNKPHYPNSMLNELTREDVSDILLSNRFMELFTRSMEDRECFKEHSNSAGKVVAAFGKNGTIYHRFDLVLPIKSSVSRGKEREVIIETDNFIMSIKVTCSECNHNLPRGFSDYYIGNKYNEISSFGVDLDIDVKFKLMSVLSKNNWDYHEWLDSFLPRLEEQMCASSYFEQIHWSLAHTIIQCGEVSKLKSEQSTEDENA
ncbi:hypothetical protein LFR79_003549 [Vibrio cholerae]|nr:hypothetical protein [Vibrio cholerae]